MGKRELVALLSVSSWCLVIDCCVALPRGAMCWSAVCDCGISCSYSLTISESQSLVFFSVRLRQVLLYLYSLIYILSIY